jgi:glycosyltransferase involved in cell wall biosynthesis
MNPLVSIIIPTRNEAPTIQTALESLLQQTYTNLEIIVVDDGSTDNTETIVRNLMQKDSRISYYILPQQDVKRKNWRGYDINGGYSGRNFGFKIAKGEWITCQDADDASLLNRIEIQLELAQKYNATLITTDWFQFSSELLGKKLDIEKVFQEIPENEIVIHKDTVTALAKKTKGILMTKWFPHRFIPFPIKWFPCTRKLFFNSTEPYPGADNSMFFRKEVVAKVQFRKRDDRAWPALSGRGSGRDFVFQVAETFQNSYSFKIPLYLWTVRRHEDYAAAYKKYLI